MKYLSLVCAETVIEGRTEAEAAKLSQEYAEFTKRIKGSGHFVGANRLKPRDTATTIRVRNGQVLVSDGPFAESKEGIGGHYLIEARDLNEAIRIAAQMPSARDGCAELRPVADDPQTLALGLDAR
jgi:hypothetical protein